MVATQNSGKRRQRVGTHTHKGGMANGDQAGESGQKVESIHGHDGDQDSVDHQHIFVADLEYERPHKQGRQKTQEDHAIDVRQKYSLFRFIGGKKITRG